MEVMRLKKDNIPAVIELLGNGKPYVLPHHDYVYWIMEEYFPSSNYVVSADNKIIGFICALPSIDKQSYFIWQIVVDENYRGKKVATILVNQIIDEAKLKGFNKLELTINCDNKASYNLFERTANEHKGRLKSIGEYRYKDSNEIVYSIEFRS
ncbi:GNAT family N-acetyltransferase [Anaerocolumna sedimenticola]|uniref:GNAT family N-acetyltransferase n=1 Tax=Anaerocolumna sedimenticola TaxID=2696063 RepID=A0A6P1TRL1_9FIRM|nr:GNAT family N-acetyltransferase [Anaerocolumna sedimenticola]QHQ62987.1 GNAT family N-acetyltransferase [Anaerocolumna sedimenticola]